MWLLEYFFLNSANLICRGTAISKYYIEFLGIRDNESRLYYSQCRHLKRTKVQMSILVRADTSESLLLSRTQ